MLNLGFVISQLLCFEGKKYTALRINKNFFSPSRWYMSGGSAYPEKNNKYFNSYKNLIIKHIENNNIEVIYTIYPLDNSTIYTYLDKSCFTEVEISKMLSSYELKNCNEIKS